MAAIVLRHQIITAVDDTTLERLDAVVRRERQEPGKQSVDRAAVTRMALDAFLGAIGQLPDLKQILDMPRHQKSAWLTTRQVSELFGLTVAGAGTRCKAREWPRRVVDHPGGRSGKLIQYAVPREDMQARAREVIRHHSQVNRVTVVEAAVVQPAEVRRRTRVLSDRQFVDRFAKVTA